MCTITKHYTICVRCYLNAHRNTDMFLYAFVKEKHSHLVPSCYRNIQASYTRMYLGLQEFPKEIKYLATTHSRF